MTWKAGNESTVRGYKFTYDGLDRLLNATYGETAGINANTDRFSENVTAYDKNGNIKTLQRYGQTGASTYGLIDNLTFTLGGNQLTRVDDTVTASAYNGSFEFKDGVKQANEYAYDANGNLTKDLNKGITNISYNCLNLPSVVTFSDGSTITYTYGADGTKLRTVHKIGSTTTTTDYCGNVVYENGVQKLLLTDEGYVTLSDNKYHYYLKDHQGNNRVVINQSGSVEETNHYYPFGGVFASTTSVQPYKYNGKEFDTKKGLNWYDYGARHYDVALGRFTTVDPLSERYYSIGMYAYCNNNPVRYIDPTGMSTSPIYDEEGKLLGTDDEGLQGVAIIMSKSNFKQGMSHEEALSHDLGYNGLVDDEARTNYLKSYTSLKDRPDYDGYLTLKEANKWYREGNGQPLFTSLAKIDLSGIYSLGERYVGEIKSFNLLLHSGSLNDGLVYGNVTLKRYPNHSVRAFSDKYDFEIVDTGINTSADIEIAASDLVSKVDCLCNLTDNTVVNALQTVLDKANGAKIPVFGSEIEQVKSGCVASMGIDYYQLGIKTGKMAAKILKGEEKASDTPFITASKAELYVNTAAADKIGMTLDADYIKDAAETFDKIEVK